MGGADRRPAGGSVAVVGRVGRPALHAVSPDRLVHSLQDMFVFLNAGLHNVEHLS